mmetsp:Transcript_1936/g.3123  ORF Transcript_1936/g.3123 Transcript_1936/m.3123 type:complete len:103 (-) Transcript_1936:109-417(-)
MYTDIRSKRRVFTEKFVHKEATLAITHVSLKRHLVGHAALCGSREPEMSFLATFSCSNLLWLLASLTLATEKVEGCAAFPLLVPQQCKLLAIGPTPPQQNEC